MSDNEQRSKDRKLGLVAPLTIAGVIATLLLAGALLRPGERQVDAPVAVAPPPPPAAAPAPPKEPPPLGRADLLTTAAQAAAEFAGGDPASDAPLEALAGRPFVVRIAFGCDGAQVRTAGEQAYVEYDPENRTVRLVARPADWSTLPLMQEAIDQKVEAVEGFWLPRPWLPGEACPPRIERTSPATPTPPAAQTVGIATLFAEGGSRVARRGERPYEYVRKIGNADVELLAHSYRLVLSGRLAAYSDGRAIRCWGETTAHRPLCIYAATFERIAFEDADTGAVLAEWPQ